MMEFAMPKRKEYDDYMQKFAVKPFRYARYLPRKKFAMQEIFCETISLRKKFAMQEICHAKNLLSDHFATQ